MPVTLRPLFCFFPAGSGTEAFNARITGNGYILLGAVESHCALVVRIYINSMRGAPPASSAVGVCIPRENCQNDTHA